ncbi:hypothetical protein GCM10027423_52430 [Spirosoma arcticum]
MFNLAQDLAAIVEINNFALLTFSQFDAVHHGSIFGELDSLPTPDHFPTEELIVDSPSDGTWQVSLPDDFLIAK